MAEKNNNNKRKIKIPLLVRIGLVSFACIIIIWFAVKKGDGSYNPKTPAKSVPYTTSKQTQKMKSLDTIETKNEDGTDGEYDVQLEETVENIITELDNRLNSDVIKRYLGEDPDIQKKYLTQFIKAEYVTQYPDLRCKDEIGKEIDDDYEFQGCIQIKRALAETEGTTGSSKDQMLEYMSYDKFMALVDSNDDKALNYFTLHAVEDDETTEGDTDEGDTDEGDTDEDDIDEFIDKNVEIELIVAAKDIHEKQIATNDDEVGFSEDFTVVTNRDGSRTASSSETEIRTCPIVYQSITDKFTMSFDMLWAMLVEGGDKDFVYNLAQLALDSKIIITVLDNINNSVEKVEYTYTKEHDENIAIDVTIDGYDDTFYKRPQIKDYYQTTVTTDIINTAVMDITYADVWILRYNNSYSNKITPPEETFNETYTGADREDLRDERNTETNHYYYPIDYDSLLAAINEFKDAGATDIDGRTIADWQDEIFRNFAGSIRQTIMQEGLYNSVTVKKIDKIINKEETKVIVNSNNTYTRGTPIIKKKTNPYSALSTIGLDWTKTFENGPLLAFQKGEAQWSDDLEEYMTSDGKYYKCIVDHSDNSYNYGFGYMFRYKEDWQIGALRLLYKYIYDLQDTTAVTDEEIIAEFNNNEEKYWTDHESKIEAEVVDNATMDAYMEKREELYNYIDEAKDTHGGSGIDEFTVPQLDVLTDRLYNGWTNAQLHISEIYKIVLDTNNGTITTPLSDNTALENLIKSNYRVDGELIFYWRDESRWATFTTDEYTILYKDYEKIIDKQDYKNELARDENFLTLMNKYPTVKRNIISGAEVLFGILSDSPTACEQVDIVKGLLYDLTGYSRFEVEDIDWMMELQSLYNYAPHKLDFNISGSTLRFLTKDELKEAIKTAYGDKEAIYNNLINNLDYFITMQNKYKINAVFAIAVAVRETAAGTVMPDFLTGTNNWMTVKGTYNNDDTNGTVIQETSDGEKVNWRKYPSVEAAILDFGKVINEYHQNSVSKITDKYADGEETWADDINESIKNIYLAVPGIELKDIFGDDIRSIIVEIALSQVGNVGGQPYWSWLFGHKDAWCAAFVSWVANQAGVLDDLIVKSGSVDGHWTWFEQKGRFQRGQYFGNRYTPQPGDVIFFDWANDGWTGNDGDHVGFVEKVENGRVYTIEGNSSDACNKVDYALNSQCIIGYGVIY